MIGWEREADRGEGKGGVRTNVGDELEKGVSNCDVTELDDWVRGDLAVRKAKERKGMVKALHGIVWRICMYASHAVYIPIYKWSMYAQCALLSLASSSASTKACSNSSENYIRFPFIPSTPCIDF